MAIDLTEVKAALQAKIDALTENSPMLSILQLERAANKFGTTTYYDSDGDLPPPTEFPEGSIVSTYQPTPSGPSGLFLNKEGSWNNIQTWE